MGRQGSRFLVWTLLSVVCCEIFKCELQEGSFMCELGTQSRDVGVDNWGVIDVYGK